MEHGHSDHQLHITTVISDGDVDDDDDGDSDAIIRPPRKRRRRAVIVDGDSSSDGGDGGEEEATGVSSCYSNRVAGPRGNRGGGVSVPRGFHGDDPGTESEFDLDEVEELERAVVIATEETDGPRSDSAGHSDGGSLSSSTSGSLRGFIVSDSDEDVDGDDDDDGGDGDGGAGLWRSPTRQSIVSRLVSRAPVKSDREQFSGVVMALVHAALDTEYLPHLYTVSPPPCLRVSLDHLDRILLQRQRHLAEQSRWVPRYRSRVDSYPRARVGERGVRIVAARSRCEACQLPRPPRVRVRLSGHEYHPKTLADDSFLTLDMQEFYVGSVCGRRTRLYHALRHYKLRLLLRLCIQVSAHKPGPAPEPALGAGLPAATPTPTATPTATPPREIALTLEKSGWIEERYENLQDLLSSADYFRDSSNPE